MNVTLTSLEALILKATHESLSSPDAAALEAFCSIMRDAVDGPQLAAQALAARIHSLNSREALLALTMLDRCMRRCDSNFHAEVGKFRFLNEMIKLVSPKYFADRTATEVQTRVLQLFHAWSIEYPRESKFKVAYEMLKNQGVIKETPPPLPPEDNSSGLIKPKEKSVIFDDVEKSKLLQKLLKSKKPEDLQHANRLIKTMVREEERRSEENCRIAQEVTSTLESAELLREMLELASEATPDEKQLIRDLHANCLRMRTVLQELAADISHVGSLADILEAYGVLEEVFKKYNIFATKEKLKQRATPQNSTTKTDSLLDFAGTPPGLSNGNSNASTNGTNNVIDVLGDIFSGNGGYIAEPLKPVSVNSCQDVDITEKGDKAEGWIKLDSLGEELLKQSLPDKDKRLDNFNTKPAKKIPMNALEKSPKKEQRFESNGDTLDLDFFTKKAQEKSPKLFFVPDDVMVDISTDAVPKTSNNLVKTCKTESPIDNILDLGMEHACLSETSVETNETDGMPNDKNKISDVKPLSDINVTLESVRPSKVAPVKAFEEENGLSVVLHFCKDKPRPDVNVIVISTTSKNGSPIEEFKFQPVVPKGCKVRLLPSSRTSLPAYNSFLPPPALTQVMLIAKPLSHPPIDLKFVITYSCDDEVCSEIGEVKKLPLDEIQ